MSRITFLTKERLYLWIAVQDVFNIIEISKSIPQGLSVNATITFDPRLYDGQLKIGDIVYFKIIKYEVWIPETMVAMCTAPQYVGQLEFYNK